MKKPPASAGANVSKSRAAILRAVIRLTIAGFPVLLAGSFLSDREVAADEGKNIQLPGPSPVRVELRRARIVAATDSGRLQVLRNEVDEAGPVTVVTGIPSANGEPAGRSAAGGSFLDAAAIFREEIAAGKDGARVRCGLGATLFLEGDLVGAARAYAWAAAGYPHDPDVQNGLGNVYAELSQVDQSMDQFHQLARNPFYAAVAHNNLGNVLRRVDRLDEALAEYHRAAVTDPTLVAAHYNQAGTLLQMGKFAEAAQAFHQAALQAPLFGDTFLYEGLARLRAKEPVLAAVALYRARELGVDSQALHLALGIVSQELALDHEAVGHFKKLLTLVRDDEKVYQMMAMSQVRLGDLDAAAESLEEGFVHGKQDADAHFYLGLKLLLCQKPEKATRYLMRAVAKGRRGADTFFAMGQALLQSGELAGAVRALSLAAGIKPDAAEIHFALGVALHYKGEDEEAVRHLETAVSLDPSDADNRLILVNLLQDRGEFGKCALVGEQLVNAFPELVAPRYETALCRALAGDLDRGAELLQDALDQDVDNTFLKNMKRKIAILADSGPDLPGPHLLMAIIQERYGNWSEAIRNYELFVLSSPPSDWARKALERIHNLAPSPTSR